MPTEPNKSNHYGETLIHSVPSNCHKSLGDVAVNDSQVG